MEGRKEKKAMRGLNLGLVEIFQRDVDFFVSMATYF